jgi:hypothetical protein
MIWPDGITAAPDGYMYISTSQISAAAMLHGGKAENKVPYLIYRFEPIVPGYISRWPAYRSMRGDERVRAFGSRLPQS